MMTGVILWISLRILRHYADNRGLRVASILIRRNIPAPARGFAGARAATVS